MAARQRDACGTGEDCPQPSGCLAVPDRQQALTDAFASVISPASAGLF
jgi:hypothetical protein